MFEKFLAVVILGGVVMKFIPIAGADTFIMWGTLLIACIYYPFGFLFFNEIRLREVFKKSAYANLKAKNIVFGVVAGLAASIICVGTLFKLLSLAGADQMLMIGLMMVVPLAVISMLLAFKKKKIGLFVFKRLIIIGSIGGALFFTSNLTLVKLQYRNYPAYIKAYAEFEKDPTNALLYNNLQLEYSRVILNEGHEENK